MGNNQKHSIVPLVLALLMICALITALSSLNSGSIVSYSISKAFNNVKAAGKEGTNWNNVTEAKNAIDSTEWNYDVEYDPDVNDYGIGIFSYENHDVEGHDDFVYSAPVMMALLDKKDADGEYVISDKELNTMKVTRNDFKAILQAVIDYNTRVSRSHTITYYYMKQTWQKFEEDIRDVSTNKIIGTHVYYKWVTSYVPVTKTFQAKDIEDEYKVEWQSIFALAVMSSSDTGIAVDDDGNYTGSWENDDDAATDEIVSRVDVSKLQETIEAFVYCFYYLWDGSNVDTSRDTYKWTDNSLEETTYYYKETGNWGTPLEQQSDSDLYGEGTIRTKQKIPFVAPAYIFNSFTGVEYEYARGTNSIGALQNMQRDKITTTDVGSFIHTCKIICPQFRMDEFLDIVKSIGGPKWVIERYESYENFYYEHQDAIDNNIATAMSITTEDLRTSKIQTGSKVNDVFVRDIVTEAGETLDKKYVVTEPDYTRFGSGEGYNRSIKLARGSIGDRITEEQLNEVILKFCQRNKHPDSLLIGTGKAFIDAARKNGAECSDPIAFLAIAMHESGCGTSNICRKKYNFFGWHAYTNDPSQATNWKENGIYNAIFIAIREINTNYIYRSNHRSGIDQDTYWKMRWNNGVHQYCTDGDAASGNPADHWPACCNSYRSKLEKIAEEVMQ